MTAKQKVPALSGKLTLNPDRPKKAHPLEPAAAAPQPPQRRQAPEGPDAAGEGAADLGSLPEGTAMLAARIPTELRNRFKAKVAERGMKMDQVVRALIAEYVNRD